MLTNSTKMNNTGSKIWYRQPWLLFLISIPACSVLLSSIMVYVAVVGGDSLVSDNYYKDGMAINQTLKQDRLADTLNLRPIVTITQKGLARIELSSDKMEPQAFLTLKLLHPTLETEDVVVKLLPTAYGFIGEVPSGLMGRRYLDLYSYNKSWRIREEVTLPLTQHPLNLR